MNPQKQKIQEWVDIQYDRWVSVYSSQKHEGVGVFGRFENTAVENVWTISSEFVQDFYLDSDGGEIAFLALFIIPGVQEISDNDLLFVSNKSWADEGDEYSEIALEVVFPCQTCKGSEASCGECDGSGEWTFVASRWAL